MNIKADISISEYGDSDWFVTIKRGNDNLYMAMGICQFIDEMRYWGMTIKAGTLNGETGYIFSKDFDINDIKMEIERFIVHNSI